MSLTLENDGACHLAGAALPFLDELEKLAAAQPTDRPGTRLHNTERLADIAESLSQHAGKGMAPVRAILFDKSVRNNWALGWHQDRTIVVKRRAEVAGFGPWTTKSGLIHVAPPFGLLEQMRTMRVHLDAVDDENAPLLIARGSHLHGRIIEGDIDSVVAKCGAYACLANPGDIWLYATSIVHASNVARNPRRRRVLQIDFSAHALPPPLEWLGV